jgi:hypothetical protein
MLSGFRKGSSGKRKIEQMQHNKSPRSQRLRSRKKILSLTIIGSLITILIVAGAGAYWLTSQNTATRAAGDDVNPNCSLIVPANPLSAQGLATPYQLFANDDHGACHESNINQSAFVQAAIIDPATGQISIYEPLVVDKGKKPAVQPVVPTLPQGAIVGIWFGFNGTDLTLKSKNNSLHDGNCVNGLDESVFGQFAYCNAAAFFNAANTAIQAGKLTVPTLGTARDGQTCMTARDFGLVDQDQSDNVQTQYILTDDGHLAQFSDANLAKFPNSTILGNPSDNALLTHFVDPALGCQPWQAPDLSNNGAMVSALALDELQAAAHQGTPVALIPNGDPMVLVGDDQNLMKVNLYRMGVDQVAATDSSQASTKTYCQNLLSVGVPRLKLDEPLTIPQGTPDPAMANNLFTFLAQRFSATWTNLNCKDLLGKKSPINVKTNGDGVAVSATFGNNNDSQGNSGKNNNNNSGKNNNNNSGKNSDNHKYYHKKKD